jgi:exodeoxyribonuclease V gamma subunit
MSRLRLITGRSQHTLVDALAEAIRTAPLPAFEQEQIVILSNGMARWLSMELATRLGVAAGLQFSFPNDLLDRCFTAVLPEVQSSLPFTHTALTWRIAAQLPELCRRDGFATVAGYLGDGQDDRRLLQLAKALADCFDQYTIFRPEMILDWDKGSGDHWQADLWQNITASNSGQHRAGLLAALHRHAASGAPTSRALPRRISLFGISYLPPFHIEALRLLSRYCDITCYLLNPCGEYWGTIISEQKKARLTLSPHLPEEACEYYETGNPLLSSLGTLGQEFFETLLDYGFDEEHLDPPPAADVVSPPLLAAIQHDIVALTDRSAAAAVKGLVATDDISLRIHSCHGPLREMEILYDNLLALFEKLDDLEPRQVVVMIPDIETYVPYISSVFGAHTTGRPPLPYTIADRSVRRESTLVDTFIKLLAIGESRFERSAILELLEAAPVQQRCGFSDAELADIRAWLFDCNVRWGLDADHRITLGFPGYADFSWQAGFDRLLLGYAMSPDDNASFNGIRPHAACSGSRAAALGKIADFVASLRALAAHCAGRHTLPHWADLLGAAFEQTCATDQDSSGTLAVAQALNTLREASTIHGFTGVMSLAAVREQLTELLAKGGSGYGFMGGAITFCAMLPMRSIPMRVIWLAGMNDGIFPRTARLPGFSLMNGTRRRGDRSLRDEDRYLFLEALMAAEDCFCISYTGQSDRDNSSIPPSVLVSELTDYIGRGFYQMDGTTPADVITHHRLQGFNPAYFNNSDPQHLFSYDRETCRALETRRLNGQTPRIFMHEPLPFPDTIGTTISLQQLARFLANPAAAFLRNRLNIAPFNPAEEAEEDEAFNLDALSRYTLSQDLVARILAGASHDDCLRDIRSLGVLPPLAAGDATFDHVWESSRRFATTIAPHLGEILAPLTIEVPHSLFPLSAELNGCRNGAHLRWRAARLKGKDRLAIWLDHLLLNYARPVGYPHTSIMIAQDVILELQPLDNAAELLGQLLDLYAEGMTRPLRFFPETSWALATNSTSKAESAWFGDQWRGYGGEKDHQAVQICFGSAEPWGEELERLARLVYEPLVMASPSSKK